MNQVKQIYQSFWEYNPQLFREIKGRFKGRNIAIASIISLIGQFLIYAFYSDSLPSKFFNDISNRYCTGARRRYSLPHCEQDLLNNIMINWRLWWLDIFVAMSIIGILLLLGVGTYMLIADLVKEESRGTLNFIRLTPQSAQTILFGKMLGVPILLYWVGLIAIPLHLWAGLKAGISLSLVLGFYLILALSCLCFYSGALLFGSLNTGLPGFKPWLGSGVLLFTMFILTLATMSGNHVSNTPVDWLFLFYPGTILHYLVDSTYLASRAVNYLKPGEIEQILFYGQPIFLNAGIGMITMIGNYCLWTYWLWQGLQRRFHNQINTVFSKTQSYWLSASFVALGLGFTLQTTSTSRLEDNYAILQILLTIFFLCLTAFLSPHRQTLQDWVRYRHQTTKSKRSLLKELLFGEKSPSTLAITASLLITLTYIAPSLLFFADYSDALKIFFGLCLSASMVLFYASLAQLLLLMKSNKRAVWAGVTVIGLVVLPLVYFAVFKIEPYDGSIGWLFSVIPMAAMENFLPSSVIFALMGQWLAITVTSLQMTYQLKQASKSETQVLFSSN